MFKSVCLLILVSLFTLNLVGCSRQRGGAQNPVVRGEYLVTFGGCHDCHTPKVRGPGGAPVPDAAKLLSGHPEKLPPSSWSADDMKRNVAATTKEMLTAWAGPWGVSFAINLTPDKETGIGEWSEESFIKMPRSGEHQGQPNGRDILPPMPWFDMKDLRDQDLKAIWAYLRSLPPIKNQVPFPTPPGSGAAPSGKN